MNTDKILSIPAEEYHAESRNGRYMSSHLLADFRESPELYHRKVTGEIAQTESPALALGRAAHCLILEGRMAFDDQYLVSDGPVNVKTNEPFGRTTKSYSDWLAAQTKEVLSCRDYGFITKLQKFIRWYFYCPSRVSQVYSSVIHPWPFSQYLGDMDGGNSRGCKKTLHSETTFENIGGRSEIPALRQNTVH